MNNEQLRRCRRELQAQFLRYESLRIEAEGAEYDFWASRQSDLVDEMRRLDAR